MKLQPEIQRLFQELSTTKIYNLDKNFYNLTRDSVSGDTLVDSGDTEKFVLQSLDMP